MSACSSNCIMEKNFPIISPPVKFTFCLIMFPSYILAEDIIAFLQPSFLKTNSQCYFFSGSNFANVYLTECQTYKYIKSVEKNHLN